MQNEINMKEHNNNELVKELKIKDFHIKSLEKLLVQKNPMNKESINENNINEGVKDNNADNESMMSFVKVSNR